MKTKNLIRGLTILAPYYADPDGHNHGAEHDEFHAYATDTPLSEVEVQEMKDLGWFQPDNPDDTQYDPAGSWMSFC